MCTLCFKNEELMNMFLIHTRAQSYERGWGLDEVLAKLRRVPLYTVWKSLCLVELFKLIADLKLCLSAV